MPSVMLPIPETHESVSRPTYINVARELIKHTGMPDDTSVLITGTDRQAPMKGSKLGSEDRGVNTFRQTNRMRITVSEQYLEQHALASAVKRQENVMIFSDQDLGVYMKPAYTQVEVIMSVEFRADDRQSAERWRDDIRSRASMMRDMFLHELKYHYPLPKEFLVILNHIHELKEKKAGYGEELRDWFRRCITPRASAKTTMAGTEPTLAINEKQVGVIGQFDFEYVPEKAERNDDTPAWVVNFDYKFTYDKPTSCIFEYPLLVHNQLISGRFRSKDSPYDFERLNNHWSLSRYVYDGVRGAFENKSPVAGYPIPHWDDWLPRFVPPFTTTMLNIMIMVEESDPTNIMSFSEIPEQYVIDEEFLEFIKEEAMWATIPGESVLLVTLFRDDIPLESDYVTMDENLTVRSTVALELRRRYHLRLAIVNDLFTLSRRATERLRRHGSLLKRILKAIHPEIEQRGYLPKTIGNDYVPLKEFRKAAQSVKDTTRPHQSNIEITRLNVGEFIILAEAQ